MLCGYQPQAADETSLRGVFCYLQFSTKRDQPLNFPLLKNFPLSPL
ncbi:hypothetical protein ECSE_3957 [Escherichia coli SE11]|uniref:Uncharacterized protein n=1 Tax=Escherichia coli (strain SE11) TaxID=409438 RepID=A0A979H243_ECOSE|nr:hypothetical protein ECSE_3957 [Escherichia coli SE11]